MAAMASTRSDESLYEQLLGGDMRAFDVLYERYERPLFGFIRQYVEDTAQAEEIFHEAFLAVLRERRKRRAITSFKAWIYRVTRNLCLNRIRQRDRAARAISRLAELPARETDDPASSLASVEVEEALRLAVARLPEHLRELFALRATGMSYESLAETLGIPLGTVKSRVNSMLNRLREEMST